MSDDNGASSASDTMRERASGSGLKVWLLMDADRRVVAGVLLILILAVLVGVGALEPSLLRRGMANSDPTETLFQALVGAIITGVTLVVTLVQLVLSQELGAAGDQRERMEGALDFRQDTEALFDDAPVAPAEPSAFLRALFDATEKRAKHLKDVTDASSEAGEGVHTYADEVIGNAQGAREQLDGAEFGTFDVLSAALGYNYSWKMYEARYLRAKHADTLSDETDEALAGVLKTLRAFGPAREHFKTLYFEWTLTDLSRAMVYAAVPALLVGLLALLYLGSLGPYVNGDFLGAPSIVWIVSAAVTVSISPFVLLLSYVLRIVTITKRTLAIGPFVLRETDRTADLD